MQPEIRQIRETDVESFREAVDIVARERRYLYLTEAPPIERVRTFVTSNIEKARPHIVLVAGATVAGWCTIIPLDRPVQAHVGGLAMGLRPEWRDRGWGTRLMQAALDAGDELGLTRIELTVYSNNPRAAALYRKLGFVEEGTKIRSVRIDGTYLDEIMMARLVGPGASIRPD
jgi:RimJ/RimL family protein N-acetyltransferase